MYECARVCKSIARVYKDIQEYVSVQEYARVCKSIQEYAKVCKSMQEYAKVCKSVQEYARSIYVHPLPSIIFHQHLFPGTGKL